MLTGLYPYRHGVRSNGSFALSEKYETLAGSFGTAGYQTAAFISASVLTRRYGLDRDFDLYDDDLSAVQQHIGGLVPSRTGNFTMDSALSWIRSRDRDTPFFCWIHLYDPHAPLVPPPDFAARFHGDLYSAEIAFADFQVGRLLDELEAEGIDDESYVSVIADHGEGLGEHGETSHGILIHEATIHIPWILKGPGIPENIVIRNQVSNADTAPTLAVLAGVSIPNREIENGINVLGEDALKPEVAAAREIVIETLLPRYQYGWHPLYGLRREQWKLVSGTRDELFDLARDPREVKNCSVEGAGFGEKLQEDLKPIVSAGSKEDARITLTPGEREQLEALGYLGIETVERKDAPDPRDVIGAHVNLELAMHLLSIGKIEGAKEALTQALRLDPTNVEVLNQRAQAHLGTQDYAEARKDLMKAISLDPKGADAYVFLGRLEFQEGNFQEVLNVAEIGEECRGAFERLSPLKAKALVRLGRRKEARSFIEERLKLEPEDTDLMVEKARQLWLLDHKPAEAETLLRHVIEVDALSAVARFQLVDLFSLQGRTEEAAVVLRDILRSEPGNAKAMSKLGRMQLNSDPESSIPYLEEALRLAPEDPNKMAALGVAYIRAHRVPDAEALLRKATGLAPSNPQIRNNLAILLIQQGKTTEAIEQLETILESHPDFVQGRNNLAIAYRSLGDLKRAEAEARKAIQQKPDFVDAKMTLASLYHAEKRWKDEYVVLSGLDPSLKKGREIIFPLALAAYRAGHCAETLRLLAPALKARERIGWELELAVGGCLEKSGQTNKALHHFEEAGRLSPPGKGRDEAQQAVQRLSVGLGK